MCVQIANEVRPQASFWTACWRSCSPELAAAAWVTSRTELGRSIFLRFEDPGEIDLIRASKATWKTILPVDDNVKTEEHSMAQLRAALASLVTLLFLPQQVTTVDQLHSLIKSTQTGWVKLISTPR